MATISTSKGPALISNDSITCIRAPAPGLPFTVVWGPRRAGIETKDAPQSILDQLGGEAKLAEFNTPIHSKVWLKPVSSVVTAIYPPTLQTGRHRRVGRNERDGGFGCVLEVGGRLVAVTETVEEAETLLRSLGWQPDQPLQGMLAEVDYDVFAGPPGAKEWSPW